MYISRILIDGVRAFSGRRSVDLTLTRPDGSHAGWTVVAGRNGSGKTTLLRSVVLALAGPARALQLAPATREWISAGRPKASVEVEVRIDSDIDRPKTGRLPANRLLWAGLEWESTETVSSISEARTLEVRPEALLSRNPSGIRKAAWNGSWTEQPVGWFYAGYGPFRRLLGEGSDATRLMLGPLPVARVATLFREDASLAESVQWLRFHHLRRLEKREGAEDLVRVVLAFLNDGLLPDEFEVDDVDSEGMWIRRGDQRFPLDEMSDGYRAVAALVVDLVRSLYESYGVRPETGGLVTWNDDGKPTIELPGVVLIDEVEAHLHVSWQRRIGPWLCEHFPRIQFIVTTHSPYICQGASPHGLIRLPGPTDDGTAEVLTEDEQRRIVHGTADDAVVSDLFGLESLYTPDTQRLRAELARLEIRVLQGEANLAEQERYEALRDELQSSPRARVAELRNAQ